MPLVQPQPQNAARVSLTAHITLEHGTPWLTITSHATHGPEIVTFDAPLNLTTKASIKNEIEWAHVQSGLDRPALYDAVRQFQNQQRRQKGHAA